MWRLAKPAEDNILLRLWAQLNAEDVADQPPPQRFMERSLEHLRQHPEAGRFVVLELESAICGYALLAAFWSSEQGGATCVVEELYVCVPQRGQGHARALLQGLIDGTVPPEVWPQRPVAVELEVSPDNAAALRLYESLGFLPVRNAHLRRMCK
jgi:ribosomal protein S18 acetylase RimI-like enzyme